MIGHAILSHGLESSPDATKAVALAKVAVALGWSSERPDYRPYDNDRNHGRLGNVEARLQHLEKIAQQDKRPLVLAGSSMGAFISARASLTVPVAGLFLMAPPTQLQGFDTGLEAADVPTQIIHGWDDELILAADVARWASARRAHTVFVNDSHRLAAHVEFCANEFGRFLQGLS